MMVLFSELVNHFVSVLPNDGFGLWAASSFDEFVIKWWFCSPSCLIMWWVSYHTVLLFPKLSHPLSVSFSRTVGLWSQMNYNFASQSFGWNKSHLIATLDFNTIWQIFFGKSADSRLCLILAVNKTTAILFQAQGGCYDTLQSVLCQLHFLHAKCRLQLGSQLLEDFQPNGK